MKRPSAPVGTSSPQPSRGGRLNSTQRLERNIPSGPPSATPTASVKTASISTQSKARQLAGRLAEERRRAAWLSGFQFSAFSLIMAIILTVGVLSLIPRVQELVAQRQQISALAADIAATQSDTAAKNLERDRWTDPTYIETQARERLYFVQPGDVSYLVINDLGPGELVQAGTPSASGTVQQTESQWLGTLLGSVWSAGNAPVSQSPTGAPATGEAP